MVDAGSGAGRERWRGREGTLDTTSDNLSSTSLLAAVPSDITQNDIVVVPPSAVIIDQKSQHILRQKDMVSMIKDLHLVPVLAQMLHRYSHLMVFHMSSYYFSSEYMLTYLISSPLLFSYRITSRLIFHLISSYPILSYPNL